MGMGIYWQKEDIGHHRYPLDRAIKFTQIINEKENKQEFAE